MNRTELPDDHQQRMRRARLSLEGLSVGDAFGEQFFDRSDAEMMISCRRPPNGPWRHTDDTAMAISIVNVLQRHGGINQDDLVRRFADRYAEDPGRGYGATAHEILARVGNGQPWLIASRQAFHGEGSMGNGGAMRVGPVGGYFADDFDAVVRQAAASAEVTHSHPDGKAGAIAVAVAAAEAWRLRHSDQGDRGRQLLQRAVDHTPAGLTREGLQRALELPFDAGMKTAVLTLGNGSRVIAPDTVPLALWCAARHLDSFEDALWTTISALGDCDTTCAIAGSIVAMSVGAEGIPDTWLAAREPLSREVAGTLAAH